MDRVNYYKYIRLPALRTINQNIDTTCEQKEISSLFCFFIKGISVLDRNEMRKGVQFYNRKYDFFLYEKPFRFMRLAFQIIDKPEIEEFMKINNIKDYKMEYANCNYYSMDLEKSLDTEFYNILFKDNDIKKIQNLIKFVRNKISSLEKLVNNSQKAEEMFIDMI